MFSFLSHFFGGKASHAASLLGVAVGFCASFSVHAQVSVVGVNLPEQVTLHLGTLGQPLEAEILPSNASNLNVSWSSADEDVAVVAPNGWVRPVAEGETTVTVTTADGGFTDTLTVVVDDGWTKLARHPGAKVYYVSSSEGDDANDGLSPEKPVATILEGLSRIRGGDWLLMKRGDTFKETIAYWQNGPSRDYKTVIGAYGDLSEPRPIIDPQGSEGMRLYGGSIGAPARRPDTIEHVAFVSLHLYQSRHDPNSPNYDSTGNGSTGVFLLRIGQDVLFEDLRVESFNGGFITQGEGGKGKGLRDIVVRRCAVVDNYGSQGIFSQLVYGLLIEENLFDYNGHNRDKTISHPNGLNHNLYIQGGDLGCEDVIVRRNILSRASSHGQQLRPGGLAEQNVYISNAIAGTVSYNNVFDLEDVQVYNDNVVIEGAPWSLDANNSGSTRAWGLTLNYSSGSSTFFTDIIEMRGNIVANGPSFARYDYQVIDPLKPYADVQDNITYNWGRSDDMGPGGYPDPNRTTGSYNVTLGGSNSMDEFLGVAADQRLGAWDPDYSWEGIWSYIREGFAVSGVRWRDVSEVVLEDEAIQLRVDQSSLLDYAVTPYFASNKTVMWSSSDPTVATVSPDGRVNAVAEGSATVTVTSSDRGLVDSIAVTVIARPDSFASVINATLVDAEQNLYRSEWLGDFVEVDGWGGWIWHEGFGWLNAAGIFEDSGPMWFWSLELGTWVYTTPETFPWSWVATNRGSPLLWVSLNANIWMYYGLSESGAGWLYRPTSGTWLRIARTTP